MYDLACNPLITPHQPEWIVRSVEHEGASAEARFKMKTQTVF